MKGKSEIGLKAGIEVHNQLNTKHKLFCGCSTAMEGKKKTAIVVRKQHPVASELGEYDVAAQYEMMRDRTFLYEAFDGETCHVELDEEPPHPLNQEALEVALTVATLLNCKIPDEVHVMRKTVIDGSNTTSFQRTMVIGFDGFLNYKNRKIPIDQVSLEEDAAAIEGEENGVVKYRLNRLGVPLIEVATGLLEDFAPEDIQNIAFEIGMVVRSTGKAKKTIGSIRQDINVSIRGGARNEIKGIQELGLLSKSVSNEINRQSSMIFLKDELAKRGVKKIHDDPITVNSVIDGTSNKILRSILDSGGNVYAVLLPKFGGLLKRELFEGKTVGRELADVAVAFGLKGLFHTDEDLTKYNLVEDFDKIRKHMKAKPEDAVVVIGDGKTKGRVAKEVLELARSFLKGVQEGTRSAAADGSTKFNRPLPGAKRMYPESDIVPIPISNELLREVKRNLPEPIGKKLLRIQKTYNLSKELAEQILKSDQMETFERITKSSKIEPKVVANTLVSIVKDLEKRENVDTSRITEENFIDVFKTLESGGIVKESIPEVLKFLAGNPSKSVAEAAASIGIKAMTTEEVEKIVMDAVRSADRMEKAIGIAMSKLRGRVDAKVVVETVKKFWDK